MIIDRQVKASDFRALLHAEVVGVHDDPYVLVRSPGYPVAEDTITHSADVAWVDRFHPDDAPPRWRVGPCRAYRWVPAQPDADYSRWLVPADGPGPGAFWAFEVRPAYSTPTPEDQP